MTTESPARTLPTPLTEAERAKGRLTKARLAELVEVANTLTAERSAGRTAEEAVDVAAQAYGVTVPYFRRRFAELARVAGWKSTQPSDYLTGKTTSSGGVFRGKPRPVDMVRLGGWLSAETKARYMEAKERLGWTLDEFMQAAADHALAGLPFGPEKTARVAQKGV